MAGQNPLIRKTSDNQNVTLGSVKALDPTKSFVVVDVPSPSGSASSRSQYLTTKQIKVPLSEVLAKGPAGGGGVPEAPNDGQQYARQSESWTVITGGGGGIPEAPIDGTPYARQDAGWVPVSGSGGGNQFTNIEITGSAVEAEISVTKPAADSNDKFFVVTNPTGNLLSKLSMLFDDEELDYLAEFYWQGDEETFYFDPGFYLTPAYIDYDGWIYAPQLRLSDGLLRIEKEDVDSFSQFEVDIDEGVLNIEARAIDEVDVSQFVGDSGILSSYSLNMTTTELDLTLASDDPILQIRSNTITSFPRIQLRYSSGAGNAFARMELAPTGEFEFTTNAVFNSLNPFASYTMPSTRGSAGQVLTDVAGSGTLSWETPSGGGGGIPEAPVDGNEYVRQNAAWVVNSGGSLPSNPSFNSVVINTTDAPGRDKFLTMSLTPDGNSSVMTFYNATSGTGNMIPAMGAYSEASNFAVTFKGLIPSSTNTGTITQPVMEFGIAVTDSSSDPVNGTLTDVTSRIGWGFNSGPSQGYVFTINSDGTTSSTANAVFMRGTPEEYSLPMTRGAAGQTLQDVLGNGVLSWESPVTALAQLDALPTSDGTGVSTGDYYFDDVTGTLTRKL